MSTSQSRADLKRKIESLLADLDEIHKDSPITSERAQLALELSEMLRKAIQDFGDADLGGSDSST